MQVQCQKITLKLWDCAEFGVSVLGQGVHVLRQCTTGCIAPWYASLRCYRYDINRSFVEFVEKYSCTNNHINQTLVTT